MIKYILKRSLALGLMWAILVYIIWGPERLPYALAGYIVGVLMCLIALAFMGKLKA